MTHGVELLTCETCGGAERDAEGRTRGQQLLQALHNEQSKGADDHVTVQSVRCLWACKRSCAVHVRAPSRAGYVLCDLPANQESARALLDYIKLYAESADGAVPYRMWPVALRGHFLCRTPPPNAPTPST